MPRSIRLALVGLLSAVLTLGMAEATTVTASAATSSTTRADSAACTSARAQDAAAAQDVAKKTKKFKKTKKKVKKAKKALKKARTAPHKKALKKAKKKNKSAKKNLKTAQQRRVSTSNAVVVFCGSNPANPGAPLPTSTPGVSPLQPLCNAIPELQALCAATQEAGNTSPLQPLCTAIPQLAPLCAVKPGDLANPDQLTALIKVIQANFPQGASLLQVVADLVTTLSRGDVQAALAALGMTPAGLLNLLRALGIPIPPTPLG